MLTDLLVPGLGMLSSLEEVPWLGAQPDGDPFRPRMVPGGDGARELVMLPEDMDGEAVATGIVQPKANGIRALALAGTIISREGVPMRCAAKALAGIARLQYSFGVPMVFDGEWVEPGGFNASLSAFQRGEGEGVFWLFDAVPFPAWAADNAWLPIEERLADLADRLRFAQSPHIGMLAYELVDDPEEVTKRALGAWAGGEEGIVVKRLGSGYTRRRSGNWRRWKQTVTIDVTVMDTLVKDGLLRSIMVRGPTGPLRIGSGWSAADAQRLAIDPEALIEVAYNPMPGTGKPRHARFVRFRDDKGRRQS